MVSSGLNNPYRLKGETVILMGNRATKCNRGYTLFSFQSGLK